MNQLIGVRLSQARQDAQEDVLDCGEWQRLEFLNPAREGRAIDIGHQQSGCAVHHQDIGHRDDIGMVQAGLDASLLDQSMLHALICDAQHLEYMERIQLTVAHQVHLGHAALSHQGVDLVPLDHLSAVQHLLSIIQVQILGEAREC